MAYSIVRGDITGVKSGMIAHGVNCRGVMGAGVALAIKNAWPKAFKEYSKVTPDENLAGTCQLVDVAEGLVVANCFTQVSFGRTPGVKYASVDNVRSSLTSALIACDAYGIETLHTVKIGCERGGLSWEDEVEPIFAKLSAEYQHIRILIYYI